MRGLRWVILAAMAMSLGAGAQGPQGGQAEPSTGTVTGLVIASDTQRPARFAQVQLVNIVPSTRGGFGGPVVRTDTDGTFMASRVPVGDYYVTAIVAGYIPEVALLRALVAAGGDAAALVAAVPVAHVTADGATNVTVTMQRGGVIAGHVEWEDGSPASGINVNAASTAASTVQMPAALQSFPNFGVFAGTPLVQTDDRGNFRVADLATGEYTVTATVMAGSQPGGGGRFGGSMSPLRVYAPGTFRRSDAKVIAVRAGDERSDVRMVIDLRGLHTVSGHAISANPGEGVATGGVQLNDSSDNSVNIFGQVDVDGSFKLRYVPPGTYTLRISNANSQPMVSFRGGGRDNGGSQPKGVAYQDFATTITVSDTDVTGVAVSLVPVQSQK